MNFREYITEGKKFHPIDVFQNRWVITFGKEIIDPESGAIYSIKEYKSMMQKMKKHDQYDGVFFPTEAMANKALKDFGSDNSYKVEELSYA